MLSLYYGAGKPKMSMVKVYLNENYITSMNVLNTSSDLIVKSVISQQFITISKSLLCSSFRLEFVDGKVDFDYFIWKY